MFRGITEHVLTCSFVAGLPEDVRRTIRAGSKAEGLVLTSVVASARAVLSDARTAAVGVSSQDCSPVTQKDQSRPPLSRPLAPPPWGTRGPRRCWSCGSYVPAEGKRRRRGRISAGVLSRTTVSGALVDRRWFRVLIDTGYTDTIINAQCCTQWQTQTTNITTISGDSF